MNQNNEQPVNLISVSGRIGSGKDTVGAIIKALTWRDSSGRKSNYEPIEWVKGKRKDSTDDNSFHNWQIVKFAAKLKQIASILTGIPVEKFEDQEFKVQLMEPEWVQPARYGTPHSFAKGPTYREFLQRLGTEGIRNTIHPNAWVNALFADYQPIGGVIDTRDYSTYPNWIITDTRFPNEAQAIKDRGGVMIKVERYPETISRCRAIDDCEDIPFDKNDSTHMMHYKGMMAKGHASETALNDYPFDYIIVNDGSIEELIQKVRTILYHLKVI